MVSSCIHMQLWEVISHPCPDINGRFTKSPLLMINVSMHWCLVIHTCAKNSSIMGSCCHVGSMLSIWTLRPHFNAIEIKIRLFQLKKWDWKCRQGNGTVYKLVYGSLCLGIDFRQIYPQISDAVCHQTPVAHFTNMVQLKSQQGYVITCPAMCGMKLLSHA